MFAVSLFATIGEETAGVYMCVSQFQQSCSVLLQGPYIHTVYCVMYTVLVFVHMPQRHFSHCVTSWPMSFELKLKLFSIPMSVLLIVSHYFEGKNAILWSMRALISLLTRAVLEKNSLATRPHPVM